MRTFNQFMESFQNQPHDALAAGGNDENIQWWQWVQQQNMNPQLLNQIAIALKHTAVSHDAWKTQMARQSGGPKLNSNDPRRRVWGPNALD